MITIGSCQLYHADCLDVMASLKVSHIISDPPYEAILHDAFGGLKDLRTDGQGRDVRELGFDCINPIRQQVCDLYKQVCDGWIINFCTSEGVAPWRDAIEASGMRYKRACVWVKPDAAPQFNGQGPALGHEMIVTAWAGKGHSKWNGGGRRGVFTHLTNQPDRDGSHPTQKPLPLMMELISLFTNEGDTVLDPFMGSGSTALACIKLNRKFIGIEKDEGYFNAAVNRIKACPGSGNIDKSPPPFELKA